MLLYVWLALGVSAAVVAASALFAVGRALAAWRSFRRLKRKLGEALGAMERRVGRVEDGLAHSGELATRLNAARADLQRSLATASVLAAAFGEARTLADRLTGLVPDK